MAEARVNVAAIVGSLRRGSYNRGLLRSAMLVAPAGMHLYEVQIDELPFFNEDMERAGDPPAVREFKQVLARADALLICTPEYSYSVPGVLKNALDWASRPAGRSVLRGTPAAIMGASAGRSGTMRAQLHLRQIFVQIGAIAMPFPEVYLTYAADKFNALGELSDQNSLDQIRALLTSLMRWTNDINGSRFVRG